MPAAVNTASRIRTKMKGLRVLTGGRALADR
jgi:hypothetical protein